MSDSLDSLCNAFCVAISIPVCHMYLSGFCVHLWGTIVSPLHRKARMACGQALPLNERLHVHVVTSHCLVWIAKALLTSPCAWHRAIMCCHGCFCYLASQQLFQARYCFAEKVHRNLISRLDIALPLFLEDSFCYSCPLFPIEMKSMI